MINTLKKYNIENLKRKYGTINKDDRNNNNDTDYINDMKYDISISI